MSGEKKVVVLGGGVGGVIAALELRKKLPSQHQVVLVDRTPERLRPTAPFEAGFDLLAYVPPHRAPRVVREAGLTTESGWVPVDRHTLETGNPGVYAIGDMATIPLSMGKPLPKLAIAYRQLACGFE